MVCKRRRGEGERGRRCMRVEVDGVTEPR